MQTTDDRNLRLYLDTADVSAWQTWMPSGLFYGLTTNPLLLQRADVACNLETLTEMARTGFDLGAQEIHMQVWGTDSESMLAVGRKLAAIDLRIVVKVPITREGAACAKQLIADEIPVTLTGVYASYQVLTAMALGAQYAAPYLGRMNEADRDGFEEILTMHRMTRELDSPLDILVASLRKVEDVAQLAQHGLNVFTVAPKIAEALFDDPLTAQAAADFESAARDMGAR